MITILKYVGTSLEDLVEIYILYIRSALEYCSVVWHSTLTEQQSNRIENVQKVCLKVILGSNYIDYQSAMNICGLETLHSRREHRCLQFGLKCLLHPIHATMFPVNPQKGNMTTRKKEHFIVNKARTSSYQYSTIPYIQRKLNTYVLSQQRNTH